VDGTGRKRGRKQILRCAQNDDEGRRRSLYGDEGADVMQQAGAVAFGEDELDGDVGEGPGGGAGVLGEEDDRNFGHDLFELAGGLQAVEDRHGNVEDDQVGLALNGEVDGFLAVAGLGAEFVILLGLKHFAEGFADEGIVVGDENHSGHGHPVA
jgi:hypothetical protein